MINSYLTKGFIIGSSFSFIITNIYMKYNYILLPKKIYPKKKVFYQLDDNEIFE
jgi:hypothetical protein